MDTESINNEPRIIKEPKKYMVDIMIPPACLDEDGGPCEHSKEEIKKEYNPV